MRAVRFWLYLLHSSAPARTFGSEDESFVHGTLLCDGYAPDHDNDSNPDDEYEEIVRKFAGTKKVLDQFMDNTGGASQ